MASLEKFGLKLGYILFAAAEQVSKSLQGKDVTLQEALASINVAAAFYRRQWTAESFDRFVTVHEKTNHIAVNINLRYKPK